MRFHNDAFHRRQEYELHHLRLSLLFAMSIICSLVLILRLAYLQFLEYQKFTTLSLKNQMSIIPLPPPRGIIYDATGVILADNIPVYALEIVPERVHDLPQTLKQLQALLPSITEDDLDNFKRMRMQNRSFVPIPIKLQLTTEEVAIFASHQYQFPGVNITARLLRYYPFKELTAHVLGYVGRINLEELKQVDPTQYRGTNFIGKSGLEKYYEEALHGSVGYQQVETDVRGRTLRVIDKTPPISGQGLHLTLDVRIQQVAYEAMQGKRGAVVAMRAEQGDILAMVSAPSFDPNLFVKGINQRDYQQLLQSEDRPLYNRAVRGLYPPASPVKPFISIAGLDRGIVTPETRIYDPGWYRLPNVEHAYRDWKRGGHGFVNLRRAITVSCDTYFYQLGRRLGIHAIQDILVKFGFGHLTQIDLKEETSGLVPSPQWKQQTKHLPWYPGDTLITSIGQGFMLTTPLQLANATASLSQHGRRYRPHLMSYLKDDHHHSIAFTTIEEYPVHIKNTATWDFVISSMQDVVMGQEGTAGGRFGRDTPYTVAGKTGTAQVFTMSQDEKKRNQQVSEKLRDHSLFIAFAPVDHPEIVVAVVVEHENNAPQIARKVFDAYFKTKDEKNPHE